MNSNNDKGEIPSEEKLSVLDKLKRFIVGKTPLKQYWVDTSARILFFVPLIAVWEFFVAGLDPSQLLRSRGLAILINLVIARPDGWFKDVWTKFRVVDEHSKTSKKWQVHTEAGMIIGISTYFIALSFAQASVEQMLIALPFAIILNLTTQGVYGRCRDWWRRYFNLETVAYK
jgi:hypothetical protein